MSDITERSTKAEILAALRALEARQVNGASWADVGSKIASVARAIPSEFPLLIRDTYRAGMACRRLVDGIIDELSRPVLRSKA